MSVLLLDGGLASHVESQHGALHPQLWSAGLLVPAAQPQGQVWLREAHRDFLAAGAQLIETATYQATPQALADAGAVADLAQAEACVRAAVDWAHEERAAAAGKGKVLGPRWWLKTPDLSALVVGSAGPYGATLADGSEYRGNWGLLPQQYENYHRSRLQIFAQAFSEGKMEVVALETLPDDQEALALAQLMTAEFPQLPFWMSFQCRDGQHLGCGRQLKELVQQLLSAAPANLMGLGVNCVAPEHVESLLQIISTAVSAVDRGPGTGRPLEIIWYANSGEPWDAVTKTWQPVARELHEQMLLEAATSWRRAGATIIGGCCRMGPQQIRLLAGVLQRQ